MCHMWTMSDMMCQCCTGVAEREAGIVPDAVGYSLQRELIAPIEQWLWAHQVAQVGQTACLAQHTCCCCCCCCCCCVSPSLGRIATAVGTPGRTDRGLGADNDSTALPALLDTPAASAAAALLARVRAELQLPEPCVSLAKLPFQRVCSSAGLTLHTRYPSGAGPSV
jgi:hypothetical protein